MIKLNLELDDQQYEMEIPESWDEVNVKHFCKIMELKDNVKNLTNIATSVKIVNIITDIEEEILWMMGSEDFTKLVEALSFIAEEIKAPLKESLIIEGEEYYIKSDFNDLTMGEIITLEQLMDENDGNLFRAMDVLLTIFLRKKKANGKLETFKVSFIDERKELFQKIRITDVHSLFFSFITGKEELA
jgi:hypothetical protein